MYSCCKRARFLVHPGVFGAPIAQLPRRQWRRTMCWYPSGEYEVSRALGSDWSTIAYMPIEGRRRWWYRHTLPLDIGFGDENCGKRGKEDATKWRMLKSGEVRRRMRYREQWGVLEVWGAWWSNGRANKNDKNPWGARCLSRGKRTAWEREIWFHEDVSCTPIHEVLRLHHLDHNRWIHTIRTWYTFHQIFTIKAKSGVRCHTFSFRFCPHTKHQITHQYH
jgi:hypothetical protein